MRSLLVLATMAVAALGLATDSGVSTNGKHDYRPCVGTICDGEKELMQAVAAGPSSSSTELADTKGKYPWWTGIEMGKAGAKIRIDGWFAFTCPGCREHWEDVWLPLVDKYGDRVSFVHQPFALPYQPFSYDATQCAYAVYRLSGNDPKAYRKWANVMFEKQLMVFSAWDMTVRQMWTTFASWANPLGLKTQDVVDAMNGTKTTANYDAWYQARYARQRSLPGAPTFLINNWIPADLPLGSWSLSDWSRWLDANLE